MDLNARPASFALGFAALFAPLLLNGCTEKSRADVSAPSNQIDRATNDQLKNEIDDLLAKMTLDEKIGQLNQHASFSDPTGPGGWQRN